MSSLFFLPSDLIFFSSGFHPGTLPRGRLRSDSRLPTSTLVPLLVWFSLPLVDGFFTIDLTRDLFLTAVLELPLFVSVFSAPPLDRIFFPFEAQSTCLFADTVLLLSPGFRASLLSFHIILFFFSLSRFFPLVDLILPHRLPHLYVLDGFSLEEDGSLLPADSVHVFFHTLFFFDRVSSLGLDSLLTLVPSFRHPLLWIEF